MTYKNTKIVLLMFAGLVAVLGVFLANGVYAETSEDNKVKPNEYWRTVIVPANSIESIDLLCKGSHQIQDVGYLIADKIKEPVNRAGVYVASSFQKSDQHHVILFVNPLAQDKTMHVNFTCA